MNKLCLRAWLLAGLALAAAPLSTHAEQSSAAPTGDMDTASAVNIAGRQRMLSQRMAKAYLMLGQGIAPDSAQNILRESRDQFESQLAALKAFQPNPMVRSAVVALDAEWTKCKALLDAPPSKTGAEQLYDANEALQKAAHRATLAYERISSAPLDHLINLAGRQRMLSQRMAKFYFYRTWDLYDAPAEMEFDLSRAHFTAVLIQIESSPLVSAEVKSRAAQLRREWNPYEQALLASRKPAEMRKHAPRVAELSERVLTGTEELVALIVKQAQSAHRVPVP